MHVYGGQNLNVNAHASRAFVKTTIKTKLNYLIDIFY